MTTRLRMRSFLSWLGGAGAVALSWGAVGCQGPATAAGPKGEMFAFDPPHTSYERVAKWTRAVVIDGTPVQRESAVTTRWQGRTRATHAAGVTLEEHLVDIVLSADGADVARVKPGPSEPVDVRYRFDGSARLTAIDGSFDAAALFQRAASGNHESKGMAVVLRDIVDAVQAERIQQRVADLVGRPATLGSTWTVLATKETTADVATGETVYTVSAREACSLGQCARVDIEQKLDPQVAANRAKEAVAAVLEQRSDLTLTEATYTQKGTTLVNPETGLRTSGRDETEGHYVVNGPKGPAKVTVRTTWETTFSNYQRLE